MSLAGREKDFDNLMVLMHFAIGQAHLVGTPRGQLTPISYAEAVNIAVLTCGQSVSYFQQGLWSSSVHGENVESMIEVGRRSGRRVSRQVRILSLRTRTTLRCIRDSC